MQGVSVEERADRETSPNESSKSEGQVNLSRSARDWRLSSRILFRFGFAYFVLYILPFPLNAIPFVEFVDRAYINLWNLVVPWVGSHVLHLGYQIPSCPTAAAIRPGTMFRFSASSLWR
jgi:hypothetical protein